MNDSRNKISTQKPLFDLLFLIQIRMKEIVQNADSGLSPLQILALRTLATEGEMSLITLAHKTGRDKSQITRIIKDLEKKHILKKKRSEQDQRSFNLKLNKGVKEKIALIINKEHELVAEMLAGISQTDRQKLEFLLGKMQKNLNNCNDD